MARMQVIIRTNDPEYLANGIEAEKTFECDGVLLVANKKVDGDTWEGTSALGGMINSSAIANGLLTPGLKEITQRALVRDFLDSVKSKEEKEPVTAI